MVCKTIPELYVRVAKEKGVMYKNGMELCSERVNVNHAAAKDI